MKLLVLTCALLLGCRSRKDPENAPPNLPPAEAEKLLLSQWSTRLGMGNTNCRMVFAAPAILEASGSSLTFRGDTAERCAKALAAEKLISAPVCKDAVCTATLNEKDASSYCDPGSPCRLVFKCGAARLEDMRVVTEGRHATITVKVRNKVTAAAFDGCPASPVSSEDRAWVAKASLDDSGRWALDGMPMSQ
jgi:hypothetical protein